MRDASCCLGRRPHAETCLLVSRLYPGCLNAYGCVGRRGGCRVHLTVGMRLCKPAHVLWGPPLTPEACLCPWSRRPGPYVADAQSETCHLPLACVCYFFALECRQWDRNLTLSLIDCVFRGNGAGAIKGAATAAVSVGGLGGAVFLATGGAALLHNTVLQGNAATSTGGGTLSTAAWKRVELPPLPPPPPTRTCCFLYARLTP